MKTKLKITFDKKLSGSASALVVFATEGGKLSGAAQKADAASKGALKRAIKAENFDGKKGQTLTVTGLDGGKHSHIFIMGLGKTVVSKSLDFEKTGTALTALLNSKKISSANIVCDDINADGAVAIASAMLLSSYRFDKYLTKEPKDKKPTLKSVVFTVSNPAAAQKEFGIRQKIAEGVYLTRDLVSEPPNVIYPGSFANAIKKELAPYGIKVNILGMKELKKLGMGALIAVGQGSVQEPKLVTMEYKKGPKSQKNVAFVGKGVTFDTGGISIKPGQGMEEMKWDMAGAGAVVGLMKTLALRKAKVNAIGVVALAENMPSGNAYRPGDIITSMSGQTIEVHNTDAEGRLILCDALWYAQEKYKPTHIVDLATLTGAVIIALGSEFAGAFSNDDKFVQALSDAGKEVGEELWRMPLHDAWDKMIDCPQADMKNISGGRDAGSAIGAHFLKRYIQDGVKWTHLDIAGVAWTNKDRPNAPKGATAFGLRLLDRYVANELEK